MAWALRDISKFLVTVKFNADGSDRGLEYALEDYSWSIYPNFIEYMRQQGAPEYFYKVKEGESVELGYHTEYVE